MPLIKFSSKTSFTLDLIRWISAQMVLIGHANSYFNLFPFFQPPTFILMQNVGVLIFFLLSGLLISHSTFSKLNKPGYTFRQFFIDRFSRIYTAFIPCLIMVLLIDLVSIHLFKNNYAYFQNFNLKTFLGNLFMLQDFPLIGEMAETTIRKAGITGKIDLSISSFGSARPFWTLAIEWWFYMAFGWLLLSGKSVVQNKLVQYALYFLFLLVPIYNLINGRGNGLTMVWFLGVVMTLLLHKYSTHVKANKSYFILSIFLATLGMGRAMFNKIQGFEYIEYDLVFAAILGAALISLIFHCQQTELKTSAFFVKTNKFLADYSFTLYLLHYSLIDFIHQSYPQLSPAVKFLIAIGCANLFCAVFAYFTEMRYKEVSNIMKAAFAKKDKTLLYN